MPSRTPVFSLLLLPLLACAQAPDHLVPDSVSMAADLAEYRLTVDKVLGRALPYRSPQMVGAPSFGNEYIVGLDRERCIVVSGEAQHQIWMYQSRGKSPNEELNRLTAEWPDDPLDVQLVMHRRPVNRGLCDRIANVWIQVVQGTRYPSTAPKYFVTDGVSYFFSTWVFGLGTLAGKTSNPERGSTAGKLVALGQAMRRFSASSTEQDLQSLEASLVAAEMAAQ